MVNNGISDSLFRRKSKEETSGHPLEGDSGPWKAVKIQDYFRNLIVASSKSIPFDPIKGFTI